MNSFFWTTSFFSDISKLRLHFQVVNNKKQIFCFESFQHFRDNKNISFRPLPAWVGHRWGAETRFCPAASELH